MKEASHFKGIDAARVLEVRFGNLLDSTPDGMLMVDLTGRIVLANRHAEKLFGYGAGEVRGLLVEALIPERFRSAHVGHRAGYAGHPRTRPMGAGMELYGVRKDGTEFPAEISLSPFKTEEGTLVISAIRDITERKRVERELQEKNAALESANQELEAFSYSISHDLRAPLRAMAGFARILEKQFAGQPSPEAQQAIQRIRDNAAKMSQLIDGLLDFSSLSWMPLTKKKVAPTAIARAVFEELHPEIASRRVEMEIAKLPACEADAKLLRQVFANLLSNALKYTRDRDPAVVKVGWREENGAGFYFVQDNGAGFDMEYAGKLFRVFQRLHSSDEFEGTGVGLAIVQRIIHRHGGRVWARGQVDRGATFCFTLGDSQSAHAKHTRPPNP